MSDPKDGRPEDALAEKIFARLRFQMIALYAITLFIALIIGCSVGGRYARLERLSEERIGLHRQLVKAIVDRLHELELEEAAARVPAKEKCPKPVLREDVERLLGDERGRPPEPAQVDRFLAAAGVFGVCEIGEARRIYADVEKMAAVDALFHVLLQRAPDAFERFNYGQWLARGTGVGVVARDIMKTIDVEPAGAPQFDYGRIRPLDLAEIHRADTEEIARRLRSLEKCARRPSDAEIVDLLRAELGRAPEGKEIQAFSEKVSEFQICDVADIRKIYEDRPKMAAVEAVYHALLSRPPDPVGRLIYGYWLSRGLAIDVAARDIMVSDEYEGLRRLGER